MSRSRRKTPIIGNTTCRSERKDKKQWHSAFRSSERAILQNTSMGDLEAHLTMTENQAVNVWSMGKDGKRYYSLQEQKNFATFKAEHDGKTHHERESMKKRILHKWMGK